MKWIIFYLNENDNIIYISSLNPSNKEIISYKNFFNFVLQHISTCICNMFEFESAINKYKTIVLYENGNWEIVHNDNTVEYSHRDIVLYNKDKVIIHKKDIVVNTDQNSKEYKFQKKIDKVKSFFINFSKNKNMKGVYIK